MQKFMHKNANSNSTAKQFNDNIALPVDVQRNIHGNIEEDRSSAGLGTRIYTPARHINGYAYLPFLKA